MIVLKILILLLWVLLALLGLLVVLTLIFLFTPVKVGVVYPEPLTLYLKWSFFKFNIFPKKQKKRKKPLKKEDFPPESAPAPLPVDSGPQAQTPSRLPPPKPVQQPKSQAAPQHPPQEPEPAAEEKKPDIQLILKIVKALLEAGKTTLSGVVFERFWVDITVGNEDKAQAAILYGVVCAGVVTLDDLAQTIFKFKQKKVNLYVDFAAEDWAFYADVLVYMRPIRGVLAMIAGYKKLKKEGITYGQLRRIIRTSL